MKIIAWGTPIVMFSVQYEIEQKTNLGFRLLSGRGRGINVASISASSWTRELPVALISPSSPVFCLVSGTLLTTRSSLTGKACFVPSIPFTWEYSRCKCSGRTECLWGFLWKPKLPNSGQSGTRSTLSFSSACIRVRSILHQVRDFKPTLRHDRFRF